MAHAHTARHPDRTARHPAEVPHVADEGLEVPEDALQRPGQTPPAESGVSGLDAPERKRLSQGWGPVPIAVILFFVAIFLAGVIAQVVALIV
jgi:hypothetical protein